jgi:hypothetical protein
MITAQVMKTVMRTEDEANRSLGIGSQTSKKVPNTFLLSAHTSRPYLGG